MRRQLYRGGGITQIGKPGGLVEPGIVKYGALDFITDPIKKVGKTVRKLIPNELADVAVKAAPFVAPFNPGIAGLMRGIGRYDQRGSLSDALKQGVATYGIGQLGQRIGTGSFQPLQNPFTREAFRSPIGAWSGPEGGFRQKAKELAFGKPEITKSDIGSIMAEGVDPGLAKHVASTEVTEGTKGLLGFGGDFNLKKAFGKGIPAVFAGSTLAALAVQKAMGDVGEREPGESLEAFNKRRKGTVGKYLDFYFRRANKFRIAPENMDAAAAKFVADNTKEYVNQGGRVGLRFGTPEAGIKSLEAGAPDITYEGNEGPQAPMKMAEFDLKEWIWESNRQSFSNSMFGKDYEDLTPDQQETIDIQLEMELGKKGPVLPSPEDPINPFAPKPTGPVLPDKMMAAKGGRIKYRMGTGPAGLPGIPRMAPDGMEFDMRMNGGFQGLGAKEGKDDVNAKLAKNEFVFTADAVRGAGGGDIELGAQRMYDTMKNLERRVV